MYDDDDEDFRIYCIHNPVFAMTRNRVMHNPISGSDVAGTIFSFLRENPGTSTTVLKSFFPTHRRAGSWTSVRTEVHLSTFHVGFPL